MTFASISVRADDVPEWYRSNYLNLVLLMLHKTGKFPFNRFSWRCCRYMLAAAVSRSLLQISSMHSFFHLVRRFWYHVFTCFSVNPSLSARAQRSSLVRYFCRVKLHFSSLSWLFVKVVRLFLHLVLVQLLLYFFPSSSSFSWSSSLPQEWTPIKATEIQWK